MAKASDNKFPRVLLTPLDPATITTPAGAESLVLDSTNGNKLSRKNSSGAVTTIEGGGGGGSTVKDPRWTPQTGETTIDEHNDATLDAAWVRVDGTGAPSANCTWTEGGDVLVARRTSAGNNTGAAKNSIVRPIGTAPATGDAWITCLTLLGPGSNYSASGIVIADGTTLGAGKQIVTRSYIANSGGPLQLQDLIPQTNYNTEGTVATQRNNLALYMPTFHRLVYKGSSQWRFDVSYDGVTWDLGGSLVTVSSFTPSHVGYWDGDIGTATKHQTNFEFLRRVSGVS